MNAKQKYYKSWIKFLKLRISFLEKKLDKAIESCPHSVQKSHGSSVCEICGENFGWWCPKSPDNTCHYFSAEFHGRRVVWLLGNTTLPHFLQEGYNPEHETEDSCIFCGEPDERT